MDAKIDRHEAVKLIGKTPEGVLEQEFTGFEAQAIQHEMDHLDGILYIERMTQADRLRNSLVLRGLEERWKRRVR
jgi:peptide deformylase